MMSGTLGAPFGGTTRGGHHGLESFALSLITPPNLVGGGGSCLPSIVVVALGEPGVPVICCAIAAGKAAVPKRKLSESIAVALILASPLLSVSMQNRAPVTARCSACRGNAR